MEDMTTELVAGGNRRFQHAQAGVSSTHPHTLATDDHSKQMNLSTHMEDGVVAGGASGIWTRADHGQEVSTEAHTRPAAVGAAACSGDRSRPTSDAGGVDWSVSLSFPFPPPSPPCGPLRVQCKQGKRSQGLPRVSTRDFYTNNGVARS